MPRHKSLVSYRYLFFKQKHKENYVLEDNLVTINKNVKYKSLTSPKYLFFYQKISRNIYL